MGLRHSGSYSTAKSGRQSGHPKTRVIDPSDDAGSTSFRLGSYIKFTSLQRTGFHNQTFVGVRDRNPAPIEHALAQSNNREYTTLSLNKQN